MPLVGHDPDHERRAADDEHVTDFYGSSDDLLGEGVDNPGGEDGLPHLADRLGQPGDLGERIGKAARRGADRDVPSGAVEQR